MLTKILAGVLAAAAVTATGVYFAYPDAVPCNRTAVSTDATAVHECCSLKAAKAAKSAAVPHACCGEEETASAESVAAFAGAMTVAVQDKTGAK
jgi:hypothetical protein